MYHLHPPGILIGEVSRPDSDPLRGLGYVCLYWVDHLEQIGEARTASDDEGVFKFISNRLLYWLEALSLSGKISEGGVAAGKLRELMVSVTPFFGREFPDTLDSGKQQQRDSRISPKTCGGLCCLTPT